MSENDGCDIVYLNKSKQKTPRRECVPSSGSNGDIFIRYNKKTMYAIDMATNTCLKFIFIL